MTTEQTKPRFQSWRFAALAALWFGIFYALLMTVRHHLTNHPGIPNLAYMFGLSFLYCAVPLFVVLWPAAGVFYNMFRQGKSE